jgi:ABC-type antimicrobial peptide transport system permease subunit
MALGADSGRVLWLVVREALVIVALGACLGVPLAIAAGRGMASLLHGVGPVDPASYAAGVGVLFLVATAAACIPAFRASRIDPMVALRGE